MAGQKQLRLIEAGATDLAPEIRAALVRLTEGHDEETCLVLTPAGVLRARANPADPTTFHLCRGDATTRTRTFRTPHWDQQRRVLCVGGQIVKRYRRPSPNQEAVLRAFEGEGWPYRIDDPLPPDGETPPKIRLHDTIRWLNRHQEHRLLRFAGDGTGEGVCWEPATASAIVVQDAVAQRPRRAA